MSDIDTTEIVKLAHSIEVAGRNVSRDVRQVVAKGALNIKTETRENVSRDPYWSRMAQTVNYSMEGNAFYSQATIGYDDVDQGELAGIYEFESVKRKPHPTLIPPCHRELPNFERAMADVAAKAIEDAL